MAEQGTAASSGYYSMSPRLLVIADDPERARRIKRAAERAGLSIIRIVDFADAAEALRQVSADVVAIEGEQVAEDRLEEVLTRVDALANHAGTSVVAVVDPEAIDLAAAILVGAGRQILCDPDASERTLALGTAAHALEPRFNDVSRDAERARLERLHEEVARIADTLARMTRGEEASPRTNGALRSPGIDYRGPDEEPRVTATELRAVLRARRMRAQFFDTALFADPAWDMLLDLFAAHLERRRVSVSSLCIAAAVPPTTALRWIGTLHDAGLFERQPDPSDRRRAYIALSAKGLEGMRGFTGAIKRAGLQLV